MIGGGSDPGVFYLGEILLGLAKSTLAHIELEGIVKLYKGVLTALFLFLVGASFLGAFYWMMRDMFWFGRGGFPWWVGVGVAVLFGAAGFWAAGPAGAVVGGPFLIAFGLGRRKGGMMDVTKNHQ